MSKLDFQGEIDLADLSCETAALLGAIMSAISDVVKAVAESKDGAVARANKKIADQQAEIDSLKAEIDSLKADAATPDDVTTLQGVKTDLDGLAPDSGVVVSPPEPTPPVEPTPVV